MIRFRHSLKAAIAAPAALHRTMRVIFPLAIAATVAAADETNAPAPAATAGTSAAVVRAATAAGTPAQAAAAGTSVAVIRVSFDFVTTNLGAVVCNITTAANIKIAADTDMEDLNRIPIAIALDAVPWNQALTLVLGSKGFSSYMNDADTVRIRRQPYRTGRHDLVSMLPEGGTNINLDCRNVPAKDVLHRIAGSGGLTLLHSPDATGMVTLAFLTMPWQEAFTLLVQTQGLSFTCVSNLVIVHKPAYAGRRQVPAWVSRGIIFAVVASPFLIGGVLLIVRRER